MKAIVEPQNPLFHYHHYLCCFQNFIRRFFQMPSSQLKFTVNISHKRIITFFSKILHFQLNYHRAPDTPFNKTLLQRLQQSSSYRFISGLQWFGGQIRRYSDIRGGYQAEDYSSVYRGRNCHQDRARSIENSLECNDDFQTKDILVSLVF